MGRMVSRTQAATTIKFEYDREEQLIAITNEHGRVYQFEWNANEELIAESGFDGLVRQFVKDPAGRTIRINRPDQRYSLLSYDPLDRITQVRHSDGSSKHFKYRADGELLAASNDSISLRWELDQLGRITKEYQGEFWVSSEYDSLGYRTRVQSSLGLDQHIERNARGDVLKISTGVDQFEAVFERDNQGLEIQRSLPGGIQTRWARDKLGRPIRHEIRNGKNLHSSKTYVWGLNNRLLKLIDSFNRETVFQHDALGNLLSARYSDNTFELRMPDAVGNLFKTTQQKDREYGPAGQLLATHSAKGTTRYEYDAEGNLIRKTDPGDRIWRYEWNGAGMMAKVIRPDGKEVTFEYDAFGRRIKKTFNNKITRWVWDGHNPLHEWIEYQNHSTENQSFAQLQTNADDIAISQRRAQLQSLEPQGPPARFNQGTKEQPITWLFEPDSFAPMAKLIGDEHYSIVNDHLGTPSVIFDKTGEHVWSANITVWGELRNLRGEKSFCPFRFPGQYEDSETGLYYNRFRYFDPEAGQYVSQDPIGLHGGPALYAYVSNPTIWLDPLGLKKTGSTSATGGAGGGPSCTAAQKSASYQGSDPYFGVDRLTDIALPKGTKVAHITWKDKGGITGNYFTTLDAVASARSVDGRVSSRALNQGVQVYAGAGRTEYKKYVQIFEVTEDIPLGGAAFGPTKANPQFNPGRYKLHDQYFILDEHFDKLESVPGSLETMKDTAAPDVSNRLNALRAKTTKGTP